MLGSLKKAALAPTENTLLQVPRALLASVAALGLDLAIFVGSMQMLGWTWFTAAFSGYLAGVVLQYVLCNLWVFSASEQKSGFLPFAVLSLFGLGITWAVLHGLHEALGIHPLIAKSAAIGLSFAWNFLSRKWLLFRAVPARSAYDIALPAASNVGAV